MPATGASRYAQATLAAAGGALCWSLDGLVLRLAGADAWQALFWRMATFAAVLMLVLLWQRRSRSIAAAFAEMGAPGLCVAVLLAATNIFFVFSITLTVVANAVVLFATVPIFSAILGRLFLHEPVHKRTVIAIAVGFACSLSIFADRLAHGAILGDLFAVLAAACFAGNVVVVRANPDTPAVPALVIAGLIAAATGLCFGKVLAVPGRDVALLMASGGIQQTAGLLLYLWAAKFLAPAETGILAFVETIFAPVWVWLAIGESPSVVVFVAGTVMVATLVWHAALGLRERSS